MHFIFIFSFYLFFCQLGDKGEQVTVPVYEETLILKDVRKDRQKQGSLAKQLLKYHCQGKYS